MGPRREVDLTLVVDVLVADSQVDYRADSVVIARIGLACVILCILSLFLFFLRILGLIGLSLGVPFSEGLANLRVLLILLFSISFELDF